MMVREDGNDIIVAGENFSLRFSKEKGSFTQISCFDDRKWQDLTPNESRCGLSWDLPVKSINWTDSKKNYTINVLCASPDWQVEKNFEIYPRGYVICSFTIKTLKDNMLLPPLSIDIPLLKVPVFDNHFNAVNLTDLQDRNFPRALGLDFSTDERPITNSINLLLEYHLDTTLMRPCGKKIKEQGSSKTLSWEINPAAYQVSENFKYSNRWALTISGVSGKPNPVRGQRIYHWYGHFPPYPANDHLDEMAEYGCSYLILHMPSFRYISGNEPIDPIEMNRVIKHAHSTGMKILFYCQPYLISRHAPYFSELKQYRTSNIDAWNSKPETQIIFYQRNNNYDCDELCLRCEPAYNFIYNGVVNFLRLYGMDGIYVDWAWPAMGICNNASHGHKPGLFNFYDYLKLIREWRKALGNDRVMIGHAGSISTSSDFIEGFDGCLTGEAQESLKPETLKVHYGNTPTLWAMHRRKEAEFRSRATIPQLVREGIVPHVGQGIMGKSVIASFDPAHQKELLPLWQMLRCFPVHRSRFYNYLTAEAVTLDNPEVFYSLYVCDSDALLILSNGGGEKSRSFPSVGVTANIDLNVTGLGKELKAWRIKGSSYETIRAEKESPIKNGTICISELGILETIAFVMFSENPPKELTDFFYHLQGKFTRLPNHYRAKLDRLKIQDNIIKDFNTEKIKNDIDYKIFMQGRTAE